MNITISEFQIYNVDANQLRRRLGISLREVADAVGCTSSLISKILNGQLKYTSTGFSPKVRAVLRRKISSAIRELDAMRFNT